VQALTDQAELVETNYRLGAWGRVLSGSATENAFLFVGGLGYWYEGTPDQYYVRARWLPAAGPQWLSRDPLATRPGTVWLADRPYYVGAQRTQALDYLRVWWDQTGGPDALSSGWIGLGARGVNGYQYVENRPLFASDPSGLIAEATLRGRCCGPNVDDWFLQELVIHALWASREVARRDISEVAKLVRFRDYAKWVPYKFMKFIATYPDGTMCLPRNCAESALTLCGKCIGDSELGNIMFGFTGNHYGYGYDVLLAGAKRAGAAKQEWDRAAIRLGLQLGPAPPATVEQMCTELTRELDWEFIQAGDANFEQCAPQSLRWGGPHTVPGAPGKTPNPGYRERCRRGAPL
jgi:hypothetical protein